MKIEQKIWGNSKDGKDIILYTLTNAKGAYVKLSSIGAGIVSIGVPDKNGKIEDVVLGYDKPEFYFGDGPCAGKTPGRYANRIAKGNLVIDDKTYSLPINNACNHLHGGPDGFQNQVWDSRIQDDCIDFMYYSKDGEANYPGNLKVNVRYQWGDDNALKITYTAETDAATVINLTNHAYFNLNGEGNGSILDHELILNASEFLPTDDTLIPKGEPCPVAGTPLDFSVSKPIGRDIKKDYEPLKFGKGYDHCFVVDGYQAGQINEVAQLYSSQSGRELTVYTTQPGIQIYTGNWLKGCPEGKNGHIYEDYDGVAMECQHFPDSPHNPEYPSTELRPGQVYEEAIIFEFSVR